MALLDIRIAPDAALRSPTQVVTSFDTSLHTFLDDMFETMLANNGIGLAAPQVGVLTQIAVIDVSSDYVEQPKITTTLSIDPAEHVYRQRLELINPVIKDGTHKVSSDEGCLSIPEYRDSISRFETVTVHAHDRLGRSFSLKATELLAFAIQHEVDHLNGVLFTDHLSRLKKSLFKKWAQRNLGTSEI
jgi:peptide deformylase